RAIHRSTVSNAVSMSIGLTPTPRMFARRDAVSAGMDAVPVTSGSLARMGGRPGLPARELGLDPILHPGVLAAEPLLQRALRFPAKDLTQAGVVRVSAPHALRSGDVPLLDPNPRDLGDQVRQLVDRDQAVRAQIERV